MKHKFTLMMTALMLLITNAFSAFGQTQYEKVTSASTDGFNKLLSHNDLARISDTIEVMIVDVNSSRALSNANGASSAPMAVPVTINNDVIGGDVDETLLWNVHKATEGYIFTVKGDNTKWLYSTNSNNGVRIGDNAANIWTVNIADGDYHGMKHNETSRFIGVYNNQDWRTYTTVHNNIKNTQIEFFIKGELPEQTQVSKPEFSPEAGTYAEAQTVTISCETEGATIYYTTNGSTPDTLSSVYYAPINIAQTTTVKAIAMKEGLDNSSIATATYTIEAPLTTMDEIFAKATAAGSTATDVTITFNNWVVTGVAGSNAYVTDGTKGLIIYGSGHGFTVGDHLTGTASCKVQLYQGSSELTNLKTTTTGLTVTPGTTVEPVVMTIGQITSGVYTGAVITINNVSYDGTDAVLSDGTNTIKPYNKLYSGMSFTDGESYNVTGLYLQYNAVKEIMPRNADDIELVQTPGTQVATPTFSPEAGTYTEAQTVTISCETEGATIYYTTNGSTPDTLSSIYYAPISISATTTVKAVAMKEGFTSSEVATAEYVINTTPVQGTLYTLITGSNGLVSGGKYIVVGIKSGSFYALGEQNSNNRASVAVTQADNIITTTPAATSTDESVYELTLGQDSVGYWTLYDAVNGGYLYAASSSSNYLKNQTTNDANGVWTIDIAPDGVATIKAQGPNSRNWMRLNNNGSPFSCYGSGQLDVYLYKAGEIPPATTVATPTFSPEAGTYAEAQTVTISCETEGATIYYTTNGSTPDTLSSVYYTPINIAQTTTVKAIAMKEGLDNSNIATATYTIEAPLTTMDEIFAKATAAGSTATDVTITFNNWVVTGVAGSNAYVTDGTKGLIIYGSGHGFTVGDHLTGTASCKVQLYQGSSELTNLKTTTTGLTVTPGTTVEPVVMTIGQITSGVYTGAVITIGNVSYDGTDAVLSDGTNTIKPFNKLYSGMSFTDGESYNVTGLYLQYNAVKEIMPRNADDIELVQTPGTQVATPTFSPEAGTYTEAQTVTISCETEGATIYYTTNGSTPDTLSSVYSTPISISETTTVKAIAMKEGLDNSNIATAEYTIEVLQSGNFGRVSKASDITTDGTYLLVCVSAGTAATSTVSSSALQTSSVTITNNVITTGYNTDGKPYAVTIETATGGYYIKLNNGKYINNSSSTGISASETASSVWAFNSYEGGMIAQNTSNSNRFLGGASAAGATYKAYAASNLGGETNPVVMLFKKDLTPSVESVAAPTFSPEAGTYTEAQTVTISCETEGATIYYTTNGSTPDTLSSVYYTPINIAQTTTVKAVAMKEGLDNSNIATATYTIEAPLTTMDEIFAKATAAGSTATDVTISFNNWVVTGVAGSNAYLTDGTKGLIIYGSSHGFTVGDHLTGTASCKVQLYQGSSELTNLKTTTTGLTVTPGTTVEPVVMTIDQITSGVYTGAVITINNVSYDGTDAVLSDGTNTIKPYNKLYSGMSFTDGESYNVTGLYLQYNAVKEIMPRNAGDIELVQTPGTQVATPTFSPEAGTYTEAQNVTISCTTEGATIFYTTDGTTPDTLSTIYSEPISISTTTTVKAIAMKEGLDNSEVSEAEYVINTTPVTAGFKKLLSHNDLARISDTTEVMIVDVTGSKALTSANGTSSAPTAVAVTIDDDVISGDVDDALLWNVHKVAGGYMFTVKGDSTKWLYSTNSNNGVRIGTNEANVWTVDIAEGTYHGMQHNETGRYIGVYNNQDWRTYTTVHDNIKATRVEFFINGELPEQTQVSTPTFTPGAGSYFEAQNVTISCETEGATIYYTTDGTAPTTESTVYTEPIAVSATTTIKAFAVKAGMDNSVVATATYTFPSVITIAAARALENNEYALVEGIVTFIDGRNVYIQDTTASIDLYLNSNTVPDTLALGYKVRAYGKKTVYNGLVELTGIDGGDASQFSIVSGGSELPLAVKTIAEINADYAGGNMLQSTRVKIANGKIGAINTSGNTPMYQGENTINLYKMPVVEGLLENDSVTVIGIVGCFNTPQIRINSAADVEFTHPAGPGIAANPTELAGFSYTFGQGPSTTQSFAVNGNNLTASATITASENFEISTADGDSFSAQSTITLSETSFSGVNIYVRLKAGLEIGEYNDTLTFASEGAEAVNIAVSGNVVEPQQPSEYVQIPDLALLANGAKVILAARYDNDENAYFAMTAATSGKPEGVEFTRCVAENPAPGDYPTLPASIADADTLYCWTVSINGGNYTFTNANGDVLGYSSSTNFSTGGNNTAWSIVYSTSDTAAMVPSYSAFVITNVNNDGRAIALNTSHNFGPYAKSNMTGNNAASYNFFLDIFATEGGTPVCATPTITPESGTYYEVQSVTISCATEGATIYYTTDGTTPTSGSPVYSAPITVAENMTVKAIAMKEGYDNSNLATAEYTIILGATTILSQNWEGEMNGWTFVTVTGSKPWSVAQNSGNHYAYANGYNGGANEQWCISPAFNLDNYSGVTLSFVNAKNYTGPDMQLFISDDYDGTNAATATWNELTYVKSAGSWAWVESGAVSLEGYSGTNCHIGYKYTSTETEAAGWEVDDIIMVGFTSNPSLTATPTALSGFGYMEGHGPSSEQSFVVNGVNLTSDVTISMTGTDFEMSTASGEAFAAQTTITLTPTAGAVSQTVYVRMTEGLAANAYAGSVTIDSELDDITVSLAGTVTEEGESWNRIFSANDLEDGAKVIIAARYNNIENEYYAMTATTSGKPEGVLFTSVTEGSVEILPEEIALDESTYSWTVNIDGGILTFTNAAGDMIGYGGSGTNFQSNGDNTTWSIDYVLSDAASMVPEYWGFLITNTTSTTRAFAINSTYHSFGPYSTQNMTGANASGYNFCVDIFVQGGEVTPTVMTPTFSMASGTYYEEIDVEISTSTTGATIHYTTDGTEPTAASAVYTDAIHVANDMTIKAIGVKDGYVDSNIATAEYVIMSDIVVVFSQDWENGMNGWTFETFEGNKPWVIATYNNNQYANANGYGDDVDNEQWCISPEFNLNALAGQNPTLTFMNATKFEGPAVELLFTNDYDGQDPTAATWQPLTFNQSSGNYEWVSSGEISLSQFSGSICNIAFKYTSTPEAAAAWEIDDIMLYATPGTDPFIIPSTYEMTGFDYDYELGPSATQSFTLTAGNLVGNGVVTVTSSENFKLTLDEETWSNEISLEYADGQLVGQPVTVYVRMKCSLEIGTYEGTIEISGGDAECEINLSGEVLEPHGIAENLEGNISIYNGDQFIFIKNETDATLSMTMYNILGQPVMTETVTAGDNRIEHNLTTGAYIIRISDGSSVMVRKIVLR